LTVRLAKAGIKVTLLEANSKLDDRPRAGIHAPCAVLEFMRAGVLDDIRAQGFIPGDIVWRTLDGKPVLEWKDSTQAAKPEAMTTLPQGMLGAIMYKHAVASPNESVKFDHEVLNVHQDERRAWVTTQLPNGSQEEFYGDYVVGTDGANSQVRKSLFGDIFNGHTRNAQIVATDVCSTFDIPLDCH